MRLERAAGALYRADGNSDLPALWAEHQAAADAVGAVIVPPSA
jgi:hypothetical protein